MIKTLIITNKSDITTDFIVKKLNEINTSYYRLNTEDIGKHINVSLDFESQEFFITDTRLDISLNLLDVKSVYFRRPEISANNIDLTLGENNFIRAELQFTLEGIYRILENAFWISNVYAIRSAENKIYQLLEAKKLGFSIPKAQFLIVR